MAARKRNEVYCGGYMQDPCLAITRVSTKTTKSLASQLRSLRARAPMSNYAVRADLTSFQPSSAVINSAPRHLLEVCIGSSSRRELDLGVVVRLVTHKLRPHALEAVKSSMGACRIVHIEIHTVHIMRTF